MQTINFEDFKEASAQPHLTRLAKAFQSSKRVVAITGAGISVSAGIPDFRSAGGLYEQVKLKYASDQKLQVKGKDFFDISFFRCPETRPLFFQFIAELKDACQGAKPTPTHLALKRLAQQGRLMRWYTQNIDCLEERMGLSCYTGASGVSDDISLQPITTQQPIKTQHPIKPKATTHTVVTLHGTLNQVACTNCHRVSPLTPSLLDSFRAGRVTSCSACQDLVAAREAAGKRRIQRVGLLRPDIVLYNEPHPHGDVIADFIAADLSRLPGLLVVMGTSLKIAGLKKMIKDFAKAMRSERDPENTDQTDSLIVFVNKTPAPKGEWQNVFDYELIGECDAILQALETATAGKNKKAVSVESSDPKGSTLSLGSCLISGDRVIEPDEEVKEVKTKATAKSVAKPSAIPAAKPATTPVATKKPIIKKNSLISSASALPAETPESPVLSHAKSKLPLITTTPASPTPRHRISDFFSPVKAAGAAAGGLGKKAKKKGDSGLKKEADDADEHVVMTNLELTM